MHLENARSTGSPAAVESLAIIRGKVAFPPLPDGFVDRPRLHRSLAAAIERSRVVTVCATAGAGKTTAVVAATRLLDRPIAWLTVDNTDVAPGRLLTYLEAAIAVPAPQVQGVGAAALRAGIKHREAAGLLAEAVGETPIVVVLDELERLGDDEAAWAVVDALGRYLPAQARLVLLSRQTIPGVRAVPQTPMANVREPELALTADEAAAVLERLGHGDVDVVAAVAATGGWVTGVVFEAWRASAQMPGSGGEADPLYGYLSSQILDELKPDQSEFLVTSSLWSEVNAARAQWLGLRHAARRLAGLRAAHLPVTWDARGQTMRFHSRFREFLLDLLEQRDEGEVRALHLAHARRLADEGHFEESTEEFLSVGELAPALVTARRVILGVVERGDFAIAERWLEVLADVRSEEADELTVAELMLALAQLDFVRAVGLADGLAARGHRETLARSSPQAASAMGFCYLAVSRPDDVRAMLDAAPSAPGFDVVRYFVDAVDGVRWPGLVAPEPTGGPPDALLFIATYRRGFLRELEDPPGGPMSQPFTRSHRIGVLQALGQTKRALELYDQLRAAEPVDLPVMVHGPEVLIDAGRRDDALAAIAIGRRAAASTGSPNAVALIALAEARLKLRMDRDPAAARAALDRIEADRLVRTNREVVDTWYGLALLMQSHDEEALARLRRAVDGMVAGDRWLELPTAAVYLAEAQWRLGDEEAADRAADVALQAARRHGSNHLLLQALGDFPAVLSRRLDAEPGADSPWHHVGRALIAQGVPITSTLGASVELKEFGRRAIIANGTQASPSRTKAYELLAYLASDGRGRAAREELLDVLFDGRSDHASRSYLSQTIAALRDALPAGSLVIEADRVAFADQLLVTSESVRLQGMLVEAARLEGEAGLVARLEALAIHDQGEYLPGRRSLWADERALALADEVATARFEAAELAFKAGRLDQARHLNAAVLADDPTREGAWRLAMRIANSLGDQDGVLAAYQACNRALAALGTTPAPSTRQMVAYLRR